MSEGRSKKVYEFSFSLQTKQKLLGSVFAAEGAKGLQFQSYKYAKKKVIICRCQEIYISLPHFTIKPTLMTHGNTRKHPSSSLTIDDEWDGETFIEY